MEAVSEPTHLTPLNSCAVLLTVLPLYDAYCLCAAFVTQVYPFLSASYEGSCLVYQWLYLFRRSTFFSPTLRLTGMVVRHTTMEDRQEDAEAAAAVVVAAEGSVKAVGAGLGGQVARYGRVVLVAAVVGFKIMEWWTRIDEQVKTARVFCCWVWGGGGGGRVYRLTGQPFGLLLWVWYGAVQYGVQMVVLACSLLCLSVGG